MFLANFSCISQMKSAVFPGTIRPRNSLLIFDATVMLTETSRRFSSSNTSKCCCPGVALVLVAPVRSSV